MNVSTPKDSIFKIQNNDGFANVTPITNLTPTKVCKRRLGSHVTSSCKKKRNKENEIKNLKLVGDGGENSERIIAEELLIGDESFFEKISLDAESAITKPIVRLHPLNILSLSESDDLFSDDFVMPPNSEKQDSEWNTGAESSNSLNGLTKLFNESYSDLADNSANLNENSKKTQDPVILFNSESEPFGYSEFQDNFERSFTIATPITQCLNLGPFYGLPSQVKMLIKRHKGITELYGWQKECLKKVVSREKKNLVYALPTSGGKTLVAEILLLRELLCYQKNALFILPFVAIVQEKVRSLAPLAIDLGFLVEEYAAGKGIMPPRKRRRKKSILVCTIEKALAVVQSLIEVDRLDEIGLAVIDELHLVGEGSGRGATLEALITFLVANKSNIQLVGMSATIGNLSEVSQFLNAEIYTGNFRPVELTEYVKCGSTIFRVDHTIDDILVNDRDINVSDSALDSDGLGFLVAEVCPKESVLIFCASKKNCENVAALLCKQLPRNIVDHRSGEKRKILEVLSIENNGKMCPVLRECVRYGVAYHHSGLTADERKILEEAYREGIICCICCTSTLAAGVNLPAKRVILRAPYVGRDFITLSKYKQMSGRAGRTGLGATGESILVCQAGDLPKVTELLKSKMDEAVSTLSPEYCADIVTAAVNLKVANTREAIRKFLNLTLLSVQAQRLDVNIKKLTDTTIANLLKSRILIVKNGPKNGATLQNGSVHQDKLEVTIPNQINAAKFKVTNSTTFATSRVARAAMKGGMSLSIAHKVYKDLKAAKKSLNLECDLHILFLVTPYQIAEQISFNRSTFFNVYMQLKPDEQQAASVVGLSEYHISRMAMGQNPKNIPIEVISRFYVTLMLNELWKQRGVWEVASLFQVNRGQVQSLQSAASSFCFNILRFCEELEDLWALRAIIADFAPRLAYCCETELLPLMELPAIKRTRARQLYNAGFKTLQDIARAQTKQLSDSITHLSINTATQIIAAAKMKLYEKVENLKEEVEDVMEDIAFVDTAANKN